MLDYVAGRQIASYILQIPKGPHYYNRTANRTVLSELAHMLMQRSQGEFEHCLALGDRSRFEEIVQGVGSTTCRKAKCQTLLSLDMSLHQ